LCLPLLHCKPPWWSRTPGPMQRDRAPRQHIGQQEMPTVPGSRWCTDSGSLRLRPLRGRCGSLAAPQSALAFAFWRLFFASFMPTSVISYVLPCSANHAVLPSLGFLPALMLCNPCSLGSAPFPLPLPASPALRVFTCAAVWSPGAAPPTSVLLAFLWYDAYQPLPPAECLVPLE
jgi:hypothetical protein